MTDTKEYIVMKRKWALESDIYLLICPFIQQIFVKKVHVQVNKTEKKPSTLEPAF